MNSTTNLYMLERRPELFRYGNVRVIHHFGYGYYKIVEYDERPLLGFPSRTLFQPYVYGEPLDLGPSISMESATQRCKDVLGLT